GQARGFETPLAHDALIARLDQFWPVALRMPGETCRQGVCCRMGQPPCPGMTPVRTSDWMRSAPVLTLNSLCGASARRGITERGSITIEPLGSRTPFQG